MRLRFHAVRIWMLLVCLVAAAPAFALEAISIPLDATTIDLTRIVEQHFNENDKIQVSTAPAADGIVRRISVPSEQSSGVSDWVVFALANDSDEQIDRLLVSTNYRLAGSKLIWPDLGSQRILTITPSEGFPPDRIENSQHDIYRITLDPGAIVTFVAELQTANLPQFHLWAPDAYTDNVNSYTLYRGIVLGIAGLLALFLTVLFVVKGTAMFPATAALAWAVLAYVAIDFGFLDAAFNIAPASNPEWRAATEVLLAGGIVVFLYTYLHLHRWHVRYSHVAFAWLLGLVILAGVILIDPSVAAGIARISMGVTAFIGLIVVIYLALHNYDRAIMLIPTWLVLVFWVGAFWLAAIGYADNPTVQPALAGGLVLLIMLVAFTIMQHAFSGGALAQGLISDAEQKALALIGAGYAVWDWDVARDRIEVGRDVEKLLGVKRGALEGPARNWLGIIHPGDRDRFRTVLDTLVNKRRGRIDQTFRLRAADGHFLWFSLKARPIVGTDGEVMRCTGTIADVTDAKIAEERLLHDSIFDNLTGLPNRELVLDRLEHALTRWTVEGTAKPTVLVLDLDEFKAINDAHGHSVGDSVLLAISRRLSRMLRSQDTLARLHGDSFAVIVLSETGRAQIFAFADEITKALKAPISIGEQDVFLSASIGVAIPEEGVRAQELFRQGEAASFHAKKLGGGRMESFRPSLGTGNNKLNMEEELREALDGGELQLAYQPIVELADRSVAGYEALLRWEHKDRGIISPSEFIPAAEESGLIIQLGLFALERAARDLAIWQNEVFEGHLPFVSVNVSSAQLLRHDLINDVKSVLARSGVVPSTLKLEITESLVMRNPEFAAKVLAKIRDLGAGLALDDFGTGHSSMSYLQRFPFDTLKIDRSFVRSNGSATRPVILKSMVTLAHDLGMNVIAEGLESESEADELIELDCEFGQGFLFGKPISASAVTQQFRNNQSVAKTG